jgi:hypothetical protein
VSLVGGQPRRQPEVIAQRGILEASNGRYLIALYRQNHQAVELMSSIFGVCEVGSDRRLAVRADRDKADPQGNPHSSGVKSTLNRDPIPVIVAGISCSLRTLHNPARAYSPNLSRWEIS